MQELKKRKPMRLRDADYSYPGLYFLTICTKSREPILSRIVANNVTTELTDNEECRDRRPRRSEQRRPRRSEQRRPRRSVSMQY